MNIIYICSHTHYATRSSKCKLIKYHSIGLFTYITVQTCSDNRGSTAFSPATEYLSTSMVPMPGLGSTLLVIELWPSHTKIGSMYMRGSNMHISLSTIILTGKVVQCLHVLLLVIEVFPRRWALNRVGQAGLP